MTSATDLATLRDYIERSTNWREGGATRHDAIKAMDALTDSIEWDEKGIREWRELAMSNGKQAEAARATARIAIKHLQAVLVSPSDPRYVTAFENAREWLSSVGCD